MMLRWWLRASARWGGCAHRSTPAQARNHHMSMRIYAIAVIVFLASTAYLAAFASPTIFYMSNALLHLGLGAVLFISAARMLPMGARALLGASLLTGLFLAWQGSIYANRPVLIAHIAVAAAGLLLLGLWIFKQHFSFAPWFISATALVAIAPLSVRLLGPGPTKIENAIIVPTSMEEEGGGPKSPFWPSAAKTNVGGTIPSNFFMDSKLCGECHKDIYQQWESSMHHFASFNNQFYRKSIEQMQELSGTKGSKWCAGCHDHALFFNGRFDKPVKDQIDTPEAQNGLGCLSCHSITHVEGSIGNGAFTIEYPPLHELASSRQPLIRRLDRFLTYLNPEPHRRTFLKPFMKESEFCATCHKVHLDVPVNNYRWIRGFNDYDNWQASGVSGQGARSFYYPPKSSTCSDCHMALVDSKDPANRNGKIHSHRFSAANTAVANANRDQTQLAETEKFLKSGFITVDIFAVSPVDANSGVEMRRRATDTQQQLMSFNAVGEESEQTGQVFVREVGKVSAPIEKTNPVIQPGGTVRVDVVVRTRKIGHFFPGGTVDAFDVWLELCAKDADGKPVFWSGALDNSGGPVEQGAHFYRAFGLDGEGNPINKRNAWQLRSVLYARLIPPGAADVAHFRMKLPKGVKGPLKLEAKLNYRKFAHYYTEYAYAGKPGEGSKGLDHDSRAYSFVKANIPKNVSGAVKDSIPQAPVVVLATAKSELQIGSAAPTDWQPKVTLEDRERWNDWGIGMSLQGDLKGAEYAFKKVTEAEPGYADGWLNVARALIQEGETEAAKPYLAKARTLDPSLSRIYFFQALVDKTDGNYDSAVSNLQKVIDKYPRDRVVLNQVARVRFLQRKYAEAVQAAQAVLKVDTEDVQAHYTLMLAYRGIGNAEAAAREEILFRRFKADESSQTITQIRRQVSPEDNNERQMIHDHGSIPIR